MLVQKIELMLTLFPDSMKLELCRYILTILRTNLNLYKIGVTSYAIWH